MPLDFQSQIQESIKYLSSNQALKTVEADPYWPKWDSPWWHMLLLYEVGEVRKVPASIVDAYVTALNKMPLKIFPIYPGEMPNGVDPSRGTPCHCQLGNVYQVLAAWGLDVDRELPWIRPWLLRYQMADGGMSCDNAAYLVKDEIPSSMVGTIAAFEAILLYTPRSWTPEESAFLTRAANFLMERKLMFGSKTKYNSAEGVSAEKWVELCFPRFYLYDVLRGLSALLTWAEKTNQTIQPESIRDVLGLISNRFPDDRLRIGRHSFAGVGTILQSESGEWLRKQTANFFPLLTAVSTIGEVSPFLSIQWQKVKDMHLRQMGERCNERP